MLVFRVYWILLAVMSGEVISQSTFKGQECLKTHNEFRRMHENTDDLKYSEELAKEAQKHAEDLARDEDVLVFPTRKLPKKRRAIEPTTNPFFHVEMWDGEISFPDSKWDLNKDRDVPIGESIHKFCCYSYPYCPSEFFHGLNFPPSAKGVVGQWYAEAKNYDYAKGRSKSEAYSTVHFTNVVWKKTTEVGCGQSARSKKNCIYTVTRYRVAGSVGNEENYKKNVGIINSAERKSNESSANSFLTAFLVVIFILFAVIGLLALLYFKRRPIKAAYAEWKIRRGTKKAESSLRNDYDEESFRGKKSIIYKPSARRTKPSIHVVTNPPPSNTVPLKPREPIPTYQNLVALYSPNGKPVCKIERTPSDGKKALPPRPSCPPVADSPNARPVSSPPPPPPSTSRRSQEVTSDGKTSNPIDDRNQIKDSGVSQQADKKPFPNKPLLPPKKTEKKPLPDLVIAPESSTNQDEVRKPIPAPRPLKSPRASGVPTPAPRPTNPNIELQNKFQSRAIAPGRASKKNPNFRTLPLNDRGSLRRPEKTGENFKNSQTSSVDGANKSITSTGADKTTVPKKVPLAPPKKSKIVTNGQDEKPLLPKNVEQLNEERPSSVAEMRRLLEQKNQR